MLTVEQIKKVWGIKVKPNPAALWRESTSPAEMVALLPRGDERLQRWAEECEKLWRAYAHMPNGDGNAFDAEEWLQYFSGNEDGNILKRYEACSLLRCLVAPPGEPCPRCKGRKGWHDALTGNGKCLECSGSGTIPATFRPHWKTSAVVDLARLVRGDCLKCGCVTKYTTAYGTPRCTECQKIDRRAHPDYSRLPRLHEALLDAGCDDADVLSHCLAETHCEGCFVIEAILQTKGQKR